jgi:uncharacterized membrane protein YecN with MAPEG domain
MLPSIVPVYAGIFALIFVGLSMRVANTRRAMRIGLGTGSNIVLERRVRVQGNFAEYVPFALILLTFIEMQGSAKWLVQALCLALLAARVAHAYGVAQEPETIPIRASAMVVTFSVFIVASAILLINAIT